MSFITKKSPAKMDSVMTLQKDLNSFFEMMIRDPFANSGLKGASFCPSLEVKEDEKSYRVIAEIPGVSEEDIHLSLKDNALILEGEKKSETIKEEKGYVKSEISYGQFYREVPFVMEVDPEKVDANYKDGVLTVDIEKSASHMSKIRKINIKTR